MNFSEANFNLASLQDVHFSETALLSATIESARLTDVQFGSDVARTVSSTSFDLLSFQDSTLTDVTFYDRGHSMNFTDAHLTNVNFFGHVSGTDFRGAALNNVTFSPDQTFFTGGLGQVNLTGVDLSTVELPIGSHPCPLLSADARYRCNDAEGIQLNTP